MQSKTEKKLIDILSRKLLVKAILKIMFGIDTEKISMENVMKELDGK